MNTSDVLVKEARRKKKKKKKIRFFFQKIESLLNNLHRLLSEARGMQYRRLVTTAISDC
jgi:hypothetical protein